MGRTSTDVEDAVEEALGEIDAHEYCGTTVSQKESRDFLRGIVEGCRVRIAGLMTTSEKEETKEDEEENDDDEA